MEGWQICMLSSAASCKNRSILGFKAQNGKSRKVKRLPLRVPGCKKAKKKSQR